MEFSIDCLYEIFETRFGISKKDLQETASFSSLGLDSLAIISIMEDLEEMFHIKFNNTKQSSVDSIPKLYKYISDYLEMEKKA